MVFHIVRERLLMVLKIGKRKLEVELKESLKRRCEPRSKAERDEHALQLAKHRINASMNTWFQKERKKVDEPLKDLDDEIEDVLVIAVREWGFLSFWDKYHIQDINNLILILQDVNHPYCICTCIGFNYF